MRGLPCRRHEDVHAKSGLVRSRHEAGTSQGLVVGMGSQDHQSLEAVEHLLRARPPDLPPLQRRDPLRLVRPGFAVVERRRARPG